MNVSIPQHQTPAVLVLHGAWANNTLFEPFTERLRSAGYVVECPTLPSNNGARPPNASLPEDVAVVRKVLDDLVTAGHPVLPLMHSYGGFVGSEAFNDTDMTLESRARAGLSGGIARLIYIAAMMLLPGISIRDLRNNHPDDMRINYYSDGASLLTNAAEVSYNDLDPVKAKEVAGSIPTFNTGAVQYPFTNAPWRDIPTTYVYCELDRSIPVQSQEMMVKEAVEHGGMKDLELERLNAAHSPFFSVPDKVIRVIDRAWASVKNASGLTR